MNAVKVVGGLVEIGAAFKFLNTAELGYVTPENAWFDAQVVLTTWIALSAVCGFYLLGLFRTDHDHDEVKVGPGRIWSAARSSWAWPSSWPPPSSAGRPRARSGIADRRASCPPTSREFNAAGARSPAARRRGRRATEVKARSTDPETGRARAEELSTASPGA